jgi:AcrR family transcriptional regulator
MGRITKNPDERKQELIKAAQELFIEQGFYQTKVSDIVKKVQVSQGVFYYYFKSKDEVVDEIIEDYITKLISQANEILANSSLNELEKLELIAKGQLEINRVHNQNIHRIKGVDIHERILKQLVIHYVPLMASLFPSVREQERLFMTEMFMVAANVVFDPGIFQWNQEQRNNRIEFLIGFMEHSLDLEQGALSFYKDLMGYMD